MYKSDLTGFTEDTPVAAADFSSWGGEIPMDDMELPGGDKGKGKDKEESKEEEEEEKKSESGELARDVVIFFPSTTLFEVHNLIT